MMTAITDNTMTNHLGLFTSTGEVKVDETVKFLETSKRELAKAFGFSPDQLRPDRMSVRVKDKIKELSATLEFVAESFNGDIEKTLFWFNTPNPAFGGAIPKSLILRGRYKKVMAFILASRSGR